MGLKYRGRGRSRARATPPQQSIFPNPQPAEPPPPPPQHPRLRPPSSSPRLDSGFPSGQFPLSFAFLRSTLSALFPAATTKRAATARSFVGGPSGFRRAPATNIRQVRPIPSLPFPSRVAGSNPQTLMFDHVIFKTSIFFKQLGPPLSATNVVLCSFHPLTVY
jgi:hypothetical protein